ncbi:alcohol acetyltransferase [Alkalibacterium indicireducens]|uniref:Alcohol acetyltransferase n=1 Tax=Alkalibacterium indicireducens TaxID=398758 RepID=A0ABN1ASU8_9LACT
MEKKNWVRLDNASNIFLAARTDVDTKVFRFTAQMSEKVDPASLQKALIKVYEGYPLFQNVMRRGIFWYYLEHTEKIPYVQPETMPPCTAIYHYDRKELLFRVIYNENRIHIEVFHALTDGTGAMWFFEDLITEYTRLRHPEAFGENSERTPRQKQDLEDSFNRYFRKKKKKRENVPTREPFEEAYKEADNIEKSLQPYEEQTHYSNVHRVKGTITPDHRPRIIEMTTQVKDVLALSKKHKVSLTLYLTAIFMISVYESIEEKKEEDTVTVSIPVNLRQFYPSFSVRNFFSTTLMAYTFKKNQPYNIEDICQEIDNQLKKEIKPEAIEKRLKRFIGFEFHPAIRVVFRPIKDLVLKWVSLYTNRKITVAMSNLGKLSLPEMVEPYVDNINFYTAVVRPQFCVNSYKDILNILFTSPFIETDIQKRFIRYLSSEGLDIQLDVNKVTSEEFE